MVFQVSMKVATSNLSGGADSLAWSGLEFGEPVVTLPACKGKPRSGSELFWDVS